MSGIYFLNIAKQLQIVYFDLKVGQVHWNIMEQEFTYFFTSLTHCQNKVRWPDIEVFHNRLSFSSKPEGSTIFQIIWCILFPQNLLLHDLITLGFKGETIGVLIFLLETWMTRNLFPLQFISWKKTTNNAVTPQRQSQSTPKMDGWMREFNVTFA